MTNSLIMYMETPLAKTVKPVLSKFISKSRLQTNSFFFKSNYILKVKFRSITEKLQLNYFSSLNNHTSFLVITT